jgi:hypothetical protein
MNGGKPEGLCTFVRTLMSLLASAYGEVMFVVIQQDSSDHIAGVGGTCRASFFVNYFQASFCPGRGWSSIVSLIVRMEWQG